eukprot:gene12275-12412_t
MAQSWQLGLHCQVMHMQIGWEDEDVIPVSDLEQLPLAWSGLTQLVLIKCYYTGDVERFTGSQLAPVLQQLPGLQALELGDISSYLSDAALMIPKLQHVLAYLKGVTLRRLDIIECINFTTDLVELS